MSLSFVSFIWGMAFSLIHIIAVVAALKIVKQIAPVLIHAASALISFILLSVAGIMVEMQFWVAFSVLAFCSSSYLFVFGAIYKSLTLRILSAAKSRNGSLSVNQLEDAVTVPTFMERISLLNEMGNIATEKDHYSLTQKGRKTANFFQTIRKIFRIETKAVYEQMKSSDKLQDDFRSAEK